jgi:hypothetical protein
MLSWRNRLAQDAYTIEVTGSSPVESTLQITIVHKNIFF